MFNRNSLWSGIIAGILMPLIIFGILYGILFLARSWSGGGIHFDESLLQLVSPVINLFFIRYYFVTKKYDDTGRGVLLVTFVYVIAYFVLN